MSKRVIITGAMGFIGSHTAKVFKEAGYHVTGVDRAQTIPQAAKFLDQLCVDDFASITPGVASVTNADAIVHCAGTSLVGPSMTNPGEYYENNAAKTNQMMESLAKHKWHGTVVFSSSAATYGNDCEVPIVECAVQAPVNPYGQSKLMCEHIIRDHCHAHNMTGIALRYFNACGADLDNQLGHVADDTHLIPRILSAYDNNRAFTLYGNDYKTPDGTCIRDYLHVVDIAHAHLEAVQLSAAIEHGTFEAYNLGTGSGHSNKEIIAACERVVGDEIGVSLHNRRAGDPDQLVADCALFQAVTPWRPRNSDIDTIVKTAWAWQQTLLKTLG